MNSDKERIRKQFKKIRDLISIAHRKKFSKKIIHSFLKLEKLQKAIDIGIYAHTQSEPETISLIQTLNKIKKKVFLPKLNPKTKKMNFYAVQNLKDCKMGAFHILEPKESCPKAKKIDLMIVPGIAFDFEGYRLGYGKGFYDRFLKKNKNTYLVGFTFQKTLTKKLPKDPYDIPVHCVITEKNIIISSPTPADIHN